MSNVDKANHKDDEWYTEEIIVRGKRIVIKVNGETTVDFTEAEDRKPGSDFTRILSEGTFAFQAHDPGSEVHFRNIMVKKTSGMSCVAATEALIYGANNACDGCCSAAPLLARVGTTFAQLPPHPAAPGRRRTGSIEVISLGTEGAAVMSSRLTKLLPAVALAACCLRWGRPPRIICWANYTA